MRLSQKLIALTFAALIAAGCGGSDDAESSAGTTSTTAPETTDAPTTTAETTTTAAPTTSTTEDPGTLSAAAEAAIAAANGEDVEPDDGGSDDGAAENPEAPEDTDNSATEGGEVSLVAYCTTLDGVDEFLDADSDNLAALQTSISEQREALNSLVVPPEIEQAHGIFAGAFISFFDIMESNNFEISDPEFDAIFSTSAFNLAAVQVDQFRNANCEGSTANDSELVENFDFVAGQCLNEVPGGGWDVLDCNVPHDFQVYALFDIVGPEIYPGVDEVDLQAEPGCIDRFEPFIGQSYATSIYFITLLKPTPQSWLFGDREVICLAIAPNGGQLDTDLEGINQ